MSLTDYKPRILSQVSLPIKVTLAGDVYAGDMIGYSASGWVQAIASATAPIAAKLIAGEDGESGDVIDAYKSAVVMSFTGGTAGADLFLSSTAGEVKESVTGSLYQKVGFMASATMGVLSPVEEVGVMTVTRGTGDERAGYFRLYQTTAAGAGDALRAYHTVLAGIAASGAHGIHGTASFNAGATAALGIGVRATLDFVAQTASPSGTYAAAQWDSNIGAGNTMPATTAFCRVANNGAVAVGKLFMLPAVASAGMVAAHTTDAISHSVRIMAGSTVLYLMATSDASNRTGGA